MKVKTFISQSSHKDFFELVENLLANQHGRDNLPEQLVDEVKTQKEVLERIFIKYTGKFDELHRLIAEYQSQQIEIRKKIRLIQLDTKEEKQRLSYAGGLTQKMGTACKYLGYIFLHNLLFDDMLAYLLDSFNFIA
jgi:hypothetical protein